MSHLHRFYVPQHHNKYGVINLRHDFWLQDEAIIYQWRKVLRYSASQEVVLFDGIEHERLYKIVELTDREAHLQLVTDYERKLPSKEVYLLFSLLKKDKNDWVLQKCTELGVSHFIPLIAERSEKTGFNLERAEKITIEAAEQCGRSDIPKIREPLDIRTAIEELADSVDIYICEQSDDLKIENWDLKIDRPAGLLVGPEGGWSDVEKQLFKDKNLQHLNLYDFTLRAETACVAAIAKLLQ